MWKKKNHLAEGLMLSSTQVQGHVLPVIISPNVCVCVYVQI